MQELHPSAPLPELRSSSLRCHPEGPPSSWPRELARARELALAPALELALAPALELAPALALALALALVWWLFA